MVEQTKTWRPPKELYVHLWIYLVVNIGLGIYVAVQHTDFWRWYGFLIIWGFVLAAMAARSFKSSKTKGGDEDREVIHFVDWFGFGG